MRTTKIAVTIDQDLLRQLDELVEEKLFPNRSRAVQDAIRGQLRQFKNGQHTGQPNGEEMAALRKELEELRKERDRYLEAFYAVKAAEALAKPMPSYEELVGSSAN